MSYRLAACTHGYKDVARPGAAACVPRTWRDERSRAVQPLTKVLLLGARPHHQQRRHRLCQLCLREALRVVCEVRQRQLHVRVRQVSALLGHVSSAEGLGQVLEAAGPACRQQW